MTGLGVKWAQVPEGSSPPKLPCFLPPLAQAEREQTFPKAKKSHVLPPPCPKEGEGPGRPAQPASLPPTPHSGLARQTDTHRAPWGWQRMVGKRSCFACHAVAASSTEIPSSSSPSLSAKSSPCFLALAPRDQTRGDRTKKGKQKETKPNQNKAKTKQNKTKRKKKQKRIQK